MSEQTKQETQSERKKQGHIRQREKIVGLKKRKKQSQREKWGDYQKLQSMFRAETLRQVIVL